MKKRLLLLAAVLLAFTATAQNRMLENVGNSLVGVWQQVVVKPGTDKIQRYIPYLKIFNSDGTYAHLRMSTTGPAYFNAVGRWEVTAPGTFLEYVEPSLGLARRTEQQNFTIVNTPEGVFMHSRFHTVGTLMTEISETWIKCEVPSPQLTR